MQSADTNSSNLYVYISNCW